MVKFCEESPFVQDENEDNLNAAASQHLRSLKLLKIIVQVPPTLRYKVCCSE